MRRLPANLLLATALLVVAADAANAGPLARLRARLRERFGFYPVYVLPAEAPAAVIVTPVPAVEVRPVFQSPFLPQSCPTGQCPTCPQ